MGNEREQDRWLKAALEQAPAPASVECLDPETLAAFADGALTAQATAAVELHASRCSRCTAVLTAMERSSPAPVPTHVWTPARVMRWLIPLTAAATAVAIWIAVPERPTTSVVQDLKTTSEQAPIPAPVPVPVPDSRSDSIVQPETRNQNRALGTQNAEPRPQAELSGQPFAPEALRDAPSAGAAAQEVAPASPPPPVAAPSEPVAVPRQGRAREEASMSARSADTFAETVAPTAQRTAAAPKVVATSESVAPNNELFRWRVIGGTSIERSTDGGKTWAQTIQIPRDSVKGLTITGIRASSDLHATVRLSNGSEFFTANGGMSWIQLQEK